MQPHFRKIFNKLHFQANPQIEKNFELIKQQRMHHRLFSPNQDKKGARAQCDDLINASLNQNYFQQLNPEHNQMISKLLNVNSKQEWKFIPFSDTDFDEINFLKFVLI